MIYIYISLVNKDLPKTYHLRHLFTLSGCNFWLKHLKPIIFFLIEGPTCQLSKSVEKTDFWVYIKKLIYFKWIEFFNFYENYFLFGSDFSSRHQKSLENSSKLLPTSTQLESEFFSKNIYIFGKYWYFENQNFLFWDWLKKKISNKR